MDDDVVRAAIDRSRWLDDWLRQAAAHLAEYQQVMAPLQEQVLHMVNAAAAGEPFDVGRLDAPLSAEQNYRAQAAMEARNALLARIEDRLRAGPDPERRAATIYLLASRHWWWHPDRSFNAAVATVGGWGLAGLRAVFGLLAARAFNRNGFIMLTGDKQVEDLEEIVHVAEDQDVVFVKLVPLAGG
jgi:hypothetical protein